jgi:hypothetical protein
MRGLVACIFLVVSSGAAPASEVFVGAGDIAMCNRSGDESTAALLDQIPGTVFTLGDNAYQSGLRWEFESCYAPSWGRHKARTRPAVGNHEYKVAGASGYFEYFGAAAGDPANGGHYSFDLGDWHIVSLNSMCQLPALGGSCSPTSPTVTWLKADLAANPSLCTLVYFHHARFSSGRHGNTIRMTATWKAMYAAGVDVVLSGHDHGYERFAPQRPDGTLDLARGIRQFVVGTGGAQLYPFMGSPKRNSEVRQASAHGVLKLTLHADGYDWEFVPVAGSGFTDYGAGDCH